MYIKLISSSDTDPSDPNYWEGDGKDENSQIDRFIATLKIKLEIKIRYIQNLKKDPTYVCDPDVDREISIYVNIFIGNDTTTDQDIEERLKKAKLVLISVEKTIQPFIVVKIRLLSLELAVIRRCFCLCYTLRYSKKDVLILKSNQERYDSLL